MRKLALVSICLFVLGLTSCTSIVPYYKPEIQQGNVISQQQVNQLRRGMTQQAVIKILGNPVIKPAFNTNQLMYVNTVKPGRGPTTEQRLILHFKNNHLVSADGDFTFPK
jgi:outer membrane protein assembly factor BamE